MAENTENLTLKLLQEMRSEMKEVRSELHMLNTKTDGNTIILNMLAGLIHQHDERIEKLEAKK